MLEQQEARLNNRRNLDVSKIPAVFPTTPSMPNYTMDLKYYNGEIEATLVFWRERQTDGSYLPFIRVTPTTTKSVFVCGASFTVVASVSLGKFGINSTQLTATDNIRLIAEGNDTLKECGLITSPTTYIWDQYSNGAEYDTKQAFIMSRNLYLDKLSIMTVPAVDGSTTILTANQCTNTSPITTVKLPNVDNNNYNIHIPNATFGNVNIWANFQFVPSSDGSMTWKLSNYGINP
jgi:hypothetical protein